jgi:hypothetical protein
MREHQNDYRWKSVLGGVHHYHDRTFQLTTRGNATCSQHRNGLSARVCRFLRHARLCSTPVADHFPITTRQRSTSHVRLGLLSNGKLKPARSGCMIPQDTTYHGTRDTCCHINICCSAPYYIVHCMNEECLNTYTNFCTPPVTIHDHSKATYTFILVIVTTRHLTFS